MDSQHNIKRIRRGGGTRKEKKERKKEREKKKRKGENYKKKNRVESAALEQGVTELLGPEKEPERERESQAEDCRRSVLGKKRPSAATHFFAGGTRARHSTNFPHRKKKFRT